MKHSAFTVKFFKKKTVEMANRSIIDLFVISTPFQLICATEARAYFKSSDYRLVVSRPDNKTTHQEIVKLLPLLGWENHKTTILGKPLFYPMLPAAINQIKGQEVNNLFYGNQGNWTHEVFRRAIKHNKSILVDDGLATVSHYHYLHATEVWKSEITQRRALTLKLLGIKLDSEKNNLPTGIFTIFPLPSTEKIPVYRNTLRVIQKNFTIETKEIETRSFVGFIGQPAKNGMEVKDFKASLQALAAQYPGSKIIYFLHRKEVLQEVKKAYEGLNIKFHRSKLPLELEIAQMNQKFIAIASLCSTALYTLKMLYKEVDIIQTQGAGGEKKIPFYDKVSDILSQAGVIPLSCPQDSNNIEG